MNKPATTTTEDVHRLAAVFAARRARLAHDLSNAPARVERQRPLGPLRDYGYSVASGFAVVAVLPVVLRLVFRQRTFLFKLVMAILKVRKVRRSMTSRRERRRR